MINRIYKLSKTLKPYQEYLAYPCRLLAVPLKNTGTNTLLAYFAKASEKKSQRLAIIH
jgi:hypothetical protein